MRGGGCSPDRTGLHLKFPANREIYREFCRIWPFAAIFVFIRRANSNGYSQIPYATEQGIFAAITGNFLQRTGNFALENWKKKTGKTVSLRRGPPSQIASCYAERLIGTIRRECVDHLIVLGEAHLRRVVVEFAAYYNDLRIYHSLGKDAPFHRAIERVGSITSRPILGGLHHQYCRV